MLEEQEGVHCGCSEITKGVKLGSEVREDMQPGHVEPVGFTKNFGFYSDWNGVPLKGLGWEGIWSN